MKNRLSFMLLCLLLIVSLTGCNSSNYKKAMSMYDSGQYDEAEVAFAALGDYEDSAAMILECRYQKAIILLNSGDYESAISVFETISDYKDANDKISHAKREIMYENYGNVIDLLDGSIWYFNGGSNSTVKSISFSDRAIIKEVSFDGNGKHTKTPEYYSYLIDETAITLTGRLGDELVIPYKIESSSLLLDDGKYLTQNQVDDGLQGYWTERYTNTFLIVGEHEYNIYFNKGQVTSESASEAAFGNAGEYYYYGPYKGTYEFKFGELSIKMNDKFADGNEWYFNVVNGDVVAIHNGRVCSRGNGLPGQNGYEF